MEWILFDLEATCWPQHQPGNRQEIIEMGAIRINIYGEVIDDFHSMVRPVLHPTLSPYCRQLTRIDQVEVNRADIFPRVLDRFQDWVYDSDEDFTFMSWGHTDIKFLQHDCTLHQVEHEWLSPYVNVKTAYQQLRKLKHPIGLKSAIQKEGFLFEGSHHRAMDDTRNLLLIVKKYMDVWQR